MFCDKAIIHVKAGKGGDGLISFLHEKYREFGGPDGGDGGKGGDVILRVDDNINTLYWYKNHHKLKAENGESGKGRKKRGRTGQDLILAVPRGTVVYEKATEKVLADLSEIDETVVAKGGIGGFGNSHFTSSVRQAPRVAELGVPGEERELVLELKMIADVGLVGLPNVGKSTLLSVVSAAKPKIADYEFTTLIPNLGVVEEGKYGVGRGFVMADIPGLIEGASQGKGLGDEFLRHIERTKVLVHILDVTHENIASEYKTIREELKHYQIDLTDRPEIVAINKIDAVTQEVLAEKVAGLQKVLPKGKKSIIFSAFAHKNLPELLHAIELAIKNAPKEKPVEKEAKVFTIEDVVSTDIFEVTKEEDHFRISGKKIERFAIQTDFNNQHAVQRIRDILKKSGIERELRRKGAVEGDKVKILEKEFTL